MTPENKDKLGNLLRKLRRESSNKSLEALSDATGLSVSYLSLVERGKREPTISALERIASSIGTPLPVIFLYLFADSDNEDMSVRHLARAAEILRDSE